MVHAGRHARRWGAYAALGVALTFIAIGCAAEPVPTDKSNPSARDQQRSEPMQGSTPSAASATANDEPISKPASHERAETKLEISLGRVTDWLLVAFNFLLVISTAGLWRETRRLAAGADKSLENIERAFVFMKDWAFAPRADQDGNIMAWSLIPFLENSGSTPTRRLVTYLNKHEFVGDIPDSFDFPDLPASGQDKPIYRSSFIGPKARMGMQGLELQLVDLWNIWKQNKRTLLYGWADYDDIFEKTPRHRIEFCVEILVGGECDKEPNFTVVMHTKFNGADGECAHIPQPWSITQQ
jgi:hypothetical protein